MSNETLFDYAVSRGHEVIFRNLRKLKAFTVEDSHYCIAIANGMPRAEEKEIAAHELGHCEYGGTYYRSDERSAKERAEYRANKWAYYKLVPPGELREALKGGIIEYWDLAEKFDVSCEYMQSALMYYKCVGII